MAISTTMASPTRAQEDSRRPINAEDVPPCLKAQASQLYRQRTASPGSYSGHRQRRTSRRRSLNHRNVSPKRNRSGQTKLRSLTPPRDESWIAMARMPPPLRLNRSSSGGTIQKGRSRRASTGTEEMTVVLQGRSRRASIGTEEMPVVVKSRTGRRSGCKDPTATKHSEGRKSTRRSRSPRAVTSPSPGTVRRSFHRDCSITLNRAAMSPKRNSDQSSVTSEWNEMKVRANLQQNTKPPCPHNSASSWEAFICSFRNEKSSNERPSSATKPLSECTTDRLESSPQLSTVLEQIRDPAKLERMTQERRQRSPKTKVMDRQYSKVAEQANSRNILNFIKQSRRGYGQQANFDDFRVVGS